MSTDEGFALALTTTGMVYSWGRGTKVRGVRVGSVRVRVGGGGGGGVEGGWMLTLHLIIQNWNTKPRQHSTWDALWPYRLLAWRCINFPKVCRLNLLIRGRVTFMKKVLISSPRSRPKSWDEDMNYEAWNIRIKLRRSIMATYMHISA